MQRHHADPGVFIRSMATRGATGGLARASAALSRLFRSAGFDFVMIETVGVGQDEIDVAALADVTVVVLVPGMGDDIQAIKAGMMEIADIFVINKADRPGAEQTQREIEGMLGLSARHGRPHRFSGQSRSMARASANCSDDLESRQRKIRAIARNRHWEIDHLGIAVRSLDEALPFYAESLGLPVLSRETVEHEKVNVAMLPAGTSRIELLEPLDPTSTIAKFLEKRGPGLHHVAMRVPDLHALSGGSKALASACWERRAAAPADTSTCSSIQPVPVAYYGNLFRIKEQNWPESASSAAADSTPCRGFTQRRKLTSAPPSAHPRTTTSSANWKAMRWRFWRATGVDIVLSPSELNFRANIYGMKTLGVERILSLSAVGSLKEEHRPLDFVIPDQFFDRTRGRISTFFGEGLVAHVSFADPVLPAAFGYRRSGLPRPWAST